MGEYLPKRILVVEDDPAISDTVQMALEMEGYGVDTAKTAPDADKVMAEAREKGEWYDAIYLDYLFPNFPDSKLPAPTEVYARIRQYELEMGIGATAIVGCSATHEMSREMIGIPADDPRAFRKLDKPFELDDLYEAVNVRDSHN